MKRGLHVLVGVLILAGSATAVLVADRQGWLPGSARPAAGPCRHQLAAGKCPFCDKSLIAKLGQCRAHGVPEALCTRCNAALIAAFKVENDWCGEHGVPESQCLLCNPQLATLAGIRPTESAEPLATLVADPALPRTRRPPQPTCKKHGLRVRFRSPVIATQAGLQWEPVRRLDVAETLVCNAELAYDGNRHARLSPRASGVVCEVAKDLGAPIRTGEVLAVVDSAELGRAKAAYLQAEALVGLWEKNAAREQELFERKVAAEREAQEAQTRLTESRLALARAAQDLRNLGLTDAKVQAVSKTNDTSSRLEVTAPFAGQVVDRSAVVGEVVDTRSVLFVVADTSRFWAMLDVQEADAARLRLGRPVVLGVEGLRGEQFAGRITWIASHVDRATRTVRVRADVGNRDGLLRARMFGKAEVNVRDRAPAVVVPKAAVQWEGCCNVVFVRQSDSVFEPRKVRLGYETERLYVVEDGVEAGELVVTTGSFLLKTEILKGSIGAGCCEVNPGA